MLRHNKKRIVKSKGTHKLLKRFLGLFLSLLMCGSLVGPAAVKAEVGDQLIYNGILYQKAEDGFVYAIHYDVTTRDSDAELLSASRYQHPDTESILLVGGVEEGVFADYSVSRIYVEMRSDFVIGKRAFADMYVGEMTGSTVTDFSMYFRGTAGGRLAEIGEEAFASTEVDGDVTFNTSIGAIGARAFQNVDFNGHFYMGKEIDTIGEYAFEGFHAKEGVTMPKFVRHIGDGAFANCKLTDVALPYTLESLGSKVYEGCEMLTKIMLPKSDTLQDVAEDAFPDKEGLTIIVPEELTDLSPYHFDQYENLVYQLSENISNDSKVLEYVLEHHLKYKLGAEGEVMVDGEVYNPDAEPEVTESPVVTDNPPETSESPVTVSSPPAISSSPVPTVMPPVISESPVTVPSPPAISSSPAPTATSPAINTDITTEEIPAKGDSFQVGKGKYQITGKNTVSFLKPVKKSFKKISIPNMVEYKNQKYKVTKIAPKAFLGAKKLKKVVIGNQVKLVGNQAFAKCSKLEEIVFGKKVTQLGKKVLYQDYKIKKITFRGKKLKKIGKKSFSGVPRKAEIIVPKSKIKVYQRLINQA